MRIILDNIVFSLQRAGGISVYWTELLKRIGLYNNNYKVFEYKNNNVHRKEFDGDLLKIKSEPSFLLQLKRYLPILLKSSKRTIFHSSYYRVAFGRNVKNVVTIHDFTFEKFLSKRKGAFLHIRQKAFGIKYADGIICVSESTKQDLISYFPNVNKEKIKVIYNGIDNDFRNYNRKQILKNENKKYILFIGSRVSYKNFYVAVDTIKLNSNYCLYIIGPDLTSEEIAYLYEKIKNKYKLLGNVSKKQLIEYYSNAFCLLYPSSYEGFGIPIIEAMSLGCPVIAVNISSIPEVAGDAALLCNAPKPELFSNCISKLEVTSFRKEMIERGKVQSQKFSWDKMVKETMNFYNYIWKN